MTPEKIKTELEKWVEMGDQWLQFDPATIGTLPACIHHGLKAAVVKYQVRGYCGPYQRYGPLDPHPDIIHLGGLWYMVSLRKLQELAREFPGEVRCD